MITFLIFTGFAAFYDLAIYFKSEDRRKNIVRHVAVAYPGETLLSIKREQAYLTWYPDESHRSYVVNYSITLAGRDEPVHVWVDGNSVNGELPWLTSIWSA